MKLSSLAAIACFAPLVCLSIGCAREDASLPTAEYEQANARWTALLKRHQDFESATLDPAFADVIALLDAVPNDAMAREFKVKLEGFRAQAEKARSDRSARQQKLRYRPASPTSVATEPEEIAPMIAEAPSQPTKPASQPVKPEVPAQGMSAARFQELFGDCFAKTSALEIKDLGQGDVWQLDARAECQERLPDFADKSVLIVGDAIESVRLTSSLTVVEKIFFQGREITRQQRDCLEESHRLVQAGKESIDCLGERRDPYQAPAPTTDAPTTAATP